MFLHPLHQIGMDLKEAVLLITIWWMRAWRWPSVIQARQWISANPFLGALGFASAWFAAFVVLPGLSAATLFHVGKSYRFSLLDGVITLALFIGWRRYLDGKTRPLPAGLPAGTINSTAREVVSKARELGSKR